MGQEMVVADSGNAWLWRAVAVDESLRQLEDRFGEDKHRADNVLYSPPGFGDILKNLRPGSETMSCGYRVVP